MASPIRISVHPMYDDTKIIIPYILRLANAIKRDISRLISLGNQESSSKIEEHILNCKNRILGRLEVVSSIREDKKIHDEQWNPILKGALSQVYKHSDTPEFRSKLQSFLNTDAGDTSKTGIHFLQMYMKEVGRIPENQIHLPFKP